MTRLIPLRHCLRAVAAGLTLILSACTTLPDIPPDAGTAERSYASQVALEGRLSVRYFNGDNEEGIHGNFNWVQQSGKTTVSLLSPVGQTVAVIKMDARSASLQRPGEAVRHASDATTLVASVLGWPLPVNGLNQWLQGFGTDNKGKRFTAKPSQDTQSFTTSDGWRLQYVSWQNAGNDTTTFVPRRIDLFRKTAQAGNVEIRIVIDSWQAK